MIAASWLDVVNRGELATFEAWTRALPAQVAESDPRLCLARAWMLFVLGRPGEVEAEVRAAEGGTLPGPLADGSSSVESERGVGQNLGAAAAGRRGRGGAERRDRLEAGARPTAPWRPQVTNAIGMTAFWSGAFEEAETAFAETVSAGDSVGYYAAEIYALGYLAVIAAERAERAEADQPVARGPGAGRPSGSR